MAMAYWRGGLLDNVMTAIASIMYGVPDFVIALLLLMVAGVQLELFKMEDVLGGIGQDVEAGFNVAYITQPVPARGPAHHHLCLDDGRRLDSDHEKQHDLDPR